MNIIEHWNKLFNVFIILISIAIQNNIATRMTMTRYMHLIANVTLWAANLFKIFNISTTHVENTF